MAVWYCGSIDHTAVAQWAASTAYNIGAIVRQLAAPAEGDDRCFRCTTAGTSGASEPTWVLTEGSTTTDNTAVWTEVTGNSAYGWTAAHARLLAAENWADNGDTIYIADDHNESRASTMSLPNKGTAASPIFIVCVSNAAAPPTARATTALVRTTTGNSAINFLGGFKYYYGRTFKAGDGGSGTLGWNTNSANPYHHIFDTCTLWTATTNGSAVTTIGATGAGTH